MRCNSSESICSSPRDQVFLCHDSNILPLKLCKVLQTNNVYNVYISWHWTIIQIARFGQCFSCNIWAISYMWVVNNSLFKEKWKSHIMECVHLTFVFGSLCDTQCQGQKRQCDLSYNDANFVVIGGQSWHHDASWFSIDLYNATSGST